MAAVATSQGPTFNMDSLQTEHASSRPRPVSPSSPTSPGAVADDAMDVSPTSTSAMGPPNGNSGSKGAKGPDQSKKQSATGAAAAVQNPKVVQTAFVHKLYNMLEDKSIQHLISWSSSEESFLMSPSTEFSKVLSTYFKHTNVSSFVRQLNMYGFHKVSDVFHHGAPDTPLWEFKHGGGSFKKGDLESLRDIKRRASRHTLIHRDSFSTGAAKPQPQPPQSMSEPTAPIDPTDSRLNMLEQTLYDMHNRLARSEEQNTFLAARYQDLADKLSKSYQHNQELSGHLASLVDDPHHPVRRSISVMQNDIGRHMDALRASQALSNPQAQTYLPRMMDAQPTSPPPQGYDDRRRASIQVLPSQQQLRHLAPSPINIGSLSTARSSPGSGRLAPPPPGFSQPPTPPLLSQQSHIPSVAIEPPPSFLPRRHTSADIHSSNNWPPPLSSPREIMEAPPSAPLANYSTNYASSQSTLPPSGGDRHLQDKLASYSFGGSSNSAQRSSISHHPSRGSSPPPFLAPPISEPAWAQPPPVRMAFRDVFKNNGLSSPGSSGAPTRRSSMANIHSVLNSADTAEVEEDERIEDEMRKRKRIG